MLKVVAIFITQYEDTSSIEQALERIWIWNPDMESSTRLTFMVKHSEVEMNAIKAVFPSM